jgi:hypothetical protein
MREAIPTRNITAAQTTRSTRNRTLRDKETPDRTIASSYCTNAAQTISNNTTSIINYEDKLYDDYGCVTVGAAWKWTSIGVGVVSMLAAILYDASTAWALQEEASLMLYKNGVMVALLDRKDNFTTGSYAQYIFLHGSFEVDVVKGDYLDVRTIQKSSADLPLNNNALANYVCFRLNRHG